MTILFWCHFGEGDHTIIAVRMAKNGVLVFAGLFKSKENAIKWF